MKKAGLFLLGAVLGLMVSVLVLYVSGMALEYFAFRLYENEFDQQRNFNLFLAFGAIVSLCSGVFCARRFA